MIIPILLVILPLFFGLVALAIPTYHPRRAVVFTGSVVQAGLAIALAVRSWGSLPLKLSFEIPGLDVGCAIVEILAGIYIAVIAFRKKRLLTLLLAVAGMALSILAFRVTGDMKVQNLVVIDQLSLILVLIVGIVGGLVLFDATGYMRTYQEEHPEVKDRRRLFAFLLLGFLGAMYGILLSNDLRLLVVFWELTTLASFLLIGYARNPESERSAFHALNLNLAGGLAFSAAIILLSKKAGIVELDRLVFLAQSGGTAYVLAPVALLALAGIVKSAQLPFTSWLLGAMVAPTPVSALLHSSTMVKAGVFLLLRLAPGLSGTTVGYLIAFIGILTFIAGAFAAVSQRNAKRILALSTVSNLGLIVTCAGIGTYQLVWVGIFLVIFHAVAKALLFLAVGTASVGTGSLDVEDMGGLILSMPRVTLLLVVGISAMFVAPFGMLVSKWAAMEAFINMPSLVSPLMIVLLAYGSATTVLFWAKWLGILVRMPDPNAPRGLLEKHVTGAEFIAEYILAVIAVAVCGCFPLISRYAVEPYIFAGFGKSFELSRGNALITVLMVVMIVAVPSLFLLIARRRNPVLSTAYMSGRSSGADLSFSGSKGERKNLETRSYYLEKYFGEERILKICTWIGLLLVITTLGTVLL